MKAYQLLSRYYELKVQAAITALVYAESKKPEHRAEAEKLADDAMNFYINQTAPAMQKLDPIMQELQGCVMGGLHGTSIPQLIEDEKKDRADLATLFHWPKNP